MHYTRSILINASLCHWIHIILSCTSFCSIISCSLSSLSPLFFALVHHTHMSPSFDYPAYNMKATNLARGVALSFFFSSSFSKTHSLSHIVLYNPLLPVLYQKIPHSFLFIIYLVCVLLVALYNNNIYSWSPVRNYATIITKGFNNNIFLHG